MGEANPWVWGNDFFHNTVPSETAMLYREPCASLIDPNEVARSRTNQSQRGNTTQHVSRHWHAPHKYSFFIRSEL